jgi:hypothetical protein
VWIAIGIVLQVAAFLLQRAASSNSSMTSTGVQLNRTDPPRVEIHVAREVEIDH